MTASCAYGLILCAENGRKEVQKMSIAEKVIKAFETLGTWVSKLPESEEKDFVVEAFHDLCEAWKKYRLDEKKKP